MLELVDSYVPEYYITTKECSNTIMVTFVMEDEVDGNLLDIAVQRAICRYPYFRIRPIIENERYVHIPNEKPIVVRKWCGPGRFGTDETNGHIMLVSYEENRIIFEIVHHITDGGGVAPFFRTTLYYYVTEKYGVTLDTSGVNFPDTPFYEDELGDAFADYDFDNLPTPAYEYERKECLVPDDAGLVVGQGNTVYFIDVDEAQLIDLCKKTGASPNSAFSVMLMQMFRRMVPDSDKPIVCGVAINQKIVLGKPHNYRMGSSRVFAEYTKEEENQSFAELSSKTRQSIKLQCQVANVLQHERMNRLYIEKAESIPSLKKRNELFGIRKYARPLTSTYDVSYVGKQNWGDLESYISAIYAEACLTLGNSFLLEVHCVHNKFSLSIVQGFEDDKFVKAFMEILSENGIEAQLKGKKAECTSFFPVFLDAEKQENK